MGMHELPKTLTGLCLLAVVCVNGAHEDPTPMVKAVGGSFQLNVSIKSEKVLPTDDDFVEHEVKVKKYSFPDGNFFYAVQLKNQETEDSISIMTFGTYIYRIDASTL